MNYKELQAEVKRLSELTGMPCPPLNGKKVVLEDALAELQAADAEDMANERGDVDHDADSIEFFTELEDEDKMYYGLPMTVSTSDSGLIEVQDNVIVIKTATLQIPKSHLLYYQQVDRGKRHSVSTESISTPDTVAIVLATTASDIVDVVIPVATKIIKATVGLAMISVISVAYFAFVAWQHFSQYSKEVLIPKSALILKESIHRVFYYSQLAYAEVEQVKALVNGIPFVS